MEYQELFERHRSVPMVARHASLRKLSDRVHTTGISVLAAPPQLGKTRLIIGLLDQLMQAETDEVIWGYLAGSAETDDALKRCLVNLYENWTSSRCWRDEIAEYRQRLKKLKITDYSKLTRELVESTKIPGASAYSYLLKKLEKISELPDSLQLKTLTYEVIRNELKSIALVTQAPCLLVIDAMDQLEINQQKLLTSQIRRFIDEFPQLPKIHILVATRSPANNMAPAEISAWSAVESIRSDPSVEIFELGTLDLENNISDYSLLSQHIIQTIPVINDTNCKLAIDLMGGNPGIIWRWSIQFPLRVGKK